MCQQFTMNTHNPLFLSTSSEYLSVQKRQSASSPAQDVSWILRSNESSQILYSESDANSLRLTCDTECVGLNTSVAGFFPLQDGFSVWFFSFQVLPTVFFIHFWSPILYVKDIRMAASGAFLLITLSFNYFRNRRNFPMVLWRTAFLRSRLGCIRMWQTSLQWIRRCGWTSRWW